jgi:hypothetical protein
MRGYGHLDEMLNDSSSSELSGWYEYMQREDERIVQLIARAILLAFNGESKGNQRGPTQKEEIIDTTDPDFAKHFMVFTGGGPQPPPQPPQPETQSDYQIIDG